MELHQRQKEGSQQCGCRWVMSDQVESCLGLLLGTISAHLFCRRLLGVSMYVKMRGQGRAPRWSSGELGWGGSCEAGGWETAQSRG